MSSAQSTEAVLLRQQRPEEMNDKAIAEAFNAFRTTLLFAHRNGCDISLEIIEIPYPQFTAILATHIQTLLAFFASDPRFTSAHTTIDIASRVIARSFLVRILRRAADEKFPLVTAAKLRKLNVGGLDDGSELSQHVKLCCLESIVHFQSLGDQSTSEAVTAACAILWPSS